MTDGNGNVSYSVKELLANINGKIDAIIVSLNSKVDRHEFDQLRTDVDALKAAEAGRSLLSGWQRFWVGTVGVGVLAAVSTLVWLAHG